MLVQTLILKLAQRVDPRTKAGQTFQDSTSGSTITNATNATPIVVTTSVAHGLVTGNQVNILGVLGNLGANNTPAAPNWYVNVLSSTTFQLFQDSALTLGVAGTGGYTSGGTVVGALIGSVDGDRFTRQRLLDIYNDARISLAGLIGSDFRKFRKGIEFAGAVNYITNLNITAGVATKPTGYFDTIFLQDVNGLDISVLSIEVAPFITTKESSTVRFMFEVGQNIKALSGNTFIPDASTYKLAYYALVNFTLSQVTDGVTIETFDDDLQTVTLQMAEALANEVGSNEVLALGTSLLSFIQGKGVTPSQPSA